jgi:FkbM family methyltransferase
MKQRLKLAVQYLFGLFIKRINRPYVTALIVKTNNGLFAVDPEDTGVGFKLRVSGQWGVDQIESLKSFLTFESKVLTVGAHIGTLAIPIAKLCKEVVAVETNPKTYELLEKNILLNSAVNCRAINVAASNKEETIRFLLSRSNSGGSKRLPKKKSYIYYYDNSEEISVTAFSLDRYLDNSEFDMVIMDIEGSEYFALQGMQAILSKTKLLVVEFLPHHLKNVSGVTVAQFLSVIAPHFSILTIPTKNITVEPKNFLPVLSDMYNREQEDEGIIFKKS